MISGLPSASGVVRSQRESLRPPPKLSLSEWADRYFVLSPEGAAEPGRWRTLPYQKGILDAITDPEVSEVSIMKSARVGYTLCLTAAIGYYMHQDPSSILIVQPTVEDAKEFSKETITPMLRDVPVLSVLKVKDRQEIAKEESNTILHKAFRGGILSMIGANSGTGFRRKSRRIIGFDEVDAYPPGGVGQEGDPIRLGKKRSESFWNRKLIHGSTPLKSGASRIEKLFQAGDQRRFFVPCPTCGHMDFLTFSEKGKGEELAGRGHWMRWDLEDGSDAHFVCRGCGCEIEHKDKRDMIERGEWRAEKPFKGHASFHIWSAYSYAANSTWADIAMEFIAARKAGPEELQTFVNTTLGETWTEKGDAPEWTRLYQLRETYAIGVVPDPVVILTAGVDVQKDRLVWEVVGWGRDMQSWSIESGVIPGDTARDSTWADLDALLGRQWPTVSGGQLSIVRMGVDSGFNTQNVYQWARPRVGRVLACKGVAGASKSLLGSPTSVDLKINGKRVPRGCKVWPVGVDLAKSELYGRLGLDPPTKESGLPFPPGYCHFPEYGEEFFKQLTAEHLVKRVNRSGHVQYEWVVLPGRENHFLDARNYARAAAANCRIELARSAASVRATAAPATTPSAAPVPPSPVPVRTPEPPAPVSRPPRRGGWLGGGRGGGWLR